jgi:hypothetical protein
MYEEEMMTQFICFVQVEKFDEGEKIAVMKRGQENHPQAVSMQI